MESAGWSTAPYGRACAGCAQAKCKCLVTEQGGSCARCRRLNRECRPAARSRKMNPLRRSAAAKTEQLERRLDELTSLLQVAGRTYAIPTTPEAASSDSGVSSGSRTSGPSQRPTQPSSIDTPQVEDGRSVATPDSLATDEEILNSFRLRLPFIPFIHLPPAISAAEVRETSPYLWQAMAILQCKDTQRRHALHDELKELFAKVLLVDCKRSFDLLQSVLVYLAWLGLECQPRKISLGPYMQIATGLVIDIGLNRAPPQNADNPTAQFIKVGPGPCRPWVSLIRTMDERRAVLGCFLLCSTISHTLARTDSLQWTPHMTECLDILANARETPNDAVLVQLVRAQRVVDKITKGIGFEYDATVEKNLSGAPFSFYLKGLQSEIDDIRARMPQELHQNSAVLLHLYHAESTIYELSLRKSAATSDPIDLTRLDHLYACLVAVQKRFEVFLSFPVASLESAPATVLLPLAHALITLLRLSTFEYPGWDLGVVRRIADLPSLAQQMSDRFALVPETVGIRNTPGGDPDSFTTTARILLGLKAGWAARLQSIQTTAMRPVDVPPLPDIDQHFVDSLLSSQDLSWFTEYPLPGAGQS
ncbi:Zn(II)2Cys6 transcription factor domain-containing protein [Aspergillus lucknowensis]|uniref:Zn(2)-C6 fungal-type domain-containing protein n=1 Tax=Aspergillus lucknowensis TaxID=176173 RepID=A0ABR4LYX4_9EURO